MIGCQEGDIRRSIWVK